MLNLINGYVCSCLDDAELAKRGVDPAHLPRPHPASTATPAAKEEPEGEPEQPQPAEPLASVEPGVGVVLDVTG